LLESHFAPTVISTANSGASFDGEVVGWVCATAPLAAEAMPTAKAIMRQDRTLNTATPR